MTNTVLQPEFNFTAYPRYSENFEMALAAQVGHTPIANPRMTHHFGVKDDVVRYLPLRGADGKYYYQTVIAGQPKLFYVFALPRELGSLEIHDDPQFMVALECVITRETQTQYTVRPQTIHAGSQASFVMGVSYECCEADSDTPAMTVLAHNHRLNKDDLRMAHTSSALRPDIQKMWANIAINRVLDHDGLENLQHLGRDITGACQHHTNPQHALIHNRLRAG